MDYERRGRRAVERVSDDRGVEPWTEARASTTNRLGDAWREWVAAERERRGNPRWMP